MPLAAPLFANPKLLLMDEPLASLDYARKTEIMPYLERLRDHSDMPIVYVSHSVAEVARLASDMVVLAGGKVTAVGAATEILQRLDLVHAEEKGEVSAILDMSVARLDNTYGMTILASPAGAFHVAGHLGEIGKTVRVRLRARDIIIATKKPEGLSALNVLAGTITRITGEGAQAMVQISCNGVSISARITRLSADTLKLEKDKPVFAIIKTVSIDPA